MAGTFTGRPLWQAALPATGAPATLWTAPALGARVTEVTFCNTDTADHTVRLWFVPSGGAAAVANAQYYDFPIPAKATITFGRNFHMAGAGFVVGSADTGALVGCTGSGIEET